MIPPWDIRWPQIMKQVKNKDIKHFYCNLKGNIVCEKTESVALLRFFYTNRFGKFLRNFINNKYISKLYGILQDSAYSKRKIDSFIQKHNIDISQFELPKGGYKSFNDFFIRKLKLGVRKIGAGQNVLVSPADSKLLVVPDISKETEFFIKNTKFNLNRFFQDNKLAKDYEGGSLLIFRLAPYDYHRFNFPCDCIPKSPKNIHGLYDSVNPIVYKTGLQPLTENERVISLLKTDIFDTIAFVCVGALMVGKIVLIYTSDKPYNKGDEMGYFEFGGSTLVLAFKKNKIKLNNNFIQNSTTGLETEVRMGQTVAVKI